MTFRLREWFRRLWGTLRRRDSQTEEELRFHLEMAELDALRRGQDVRETRLRAGGVSASRRLCASLPRSRICLG